MAASTSLYRKYRSQTFDELVGQEPVVRTLKNAIASGRIAHAYLFTGPRGVGKTSAARLLARAANCLSEGPDRPCNECANCTTAARDIATDLIEIDAASNTGVDNIRDVIERANFAPSVWHTKFYIIDEVHMLSISAFNALLKTLEEPPPQTAFILATTEVHKVPATVASRCQRFDFRRVPLSAMLERLKYICEQEGIEAEPAALELVARQSTGSLRDALSLLDQLRVYSDEKITLASVQSLLGASGSEEVAAFVDAIIAGDLAAGLRQIGGVSDEGLDLRQFNREVVEHLRALLHVKSGAASEAALLDVTSEMRSRLKEQAERVTITDLLRWNRAFADADAALRSSAYRQLSLELALTSCVVASEEVAARPDGQDRRAEIASATEQLGILPPIKAASPAQPRPDRPAVLDTPPPPIHVELGNRSSVPLEEVAPAPTAQEREAVVADGHAGLEEAVVSDDTGGGEKVRLGGDELDRLRQLWPRVVEQIKARSRSVAAAFSDPKQVRPHSVQGRVITVGFTYPIQAKRSVTEPYRTIIEAALSHVLGYPCQLESVSIDENGNAGAPAAEDQSAGSGNAGGGRAARERPSPYETPRGRAAMNILGITKFDDPQ